MSSSYKSNAHRGIIILKDLISLTVYSIIYLKTNKKKNTCLKYSVSSRSGQLNYISTIYYIEPTYSRET